MTTPENSSLSHGPSFVGETPIDVVSRGETLPSDLTIGYVDDSDGSNHMAEVKIRRFTGIGSYGPDLAPAFHQIKREYPHLPIAWDTEARVHQLDRRLSVLWLPPANVEIFSGLIVHPDRPDGDNDWLTFAREEHARQHGGDLSHEKHQIISSPQEDTSHIWVGGRALHGVTDWFQRGIPAERKVRILGAATIPEALSELAVPIQENTDVTAVRTGRIIDFLIDAYQS